MKQSNILNIILLLIIPFTYSFAQRDYTPGRMSFDVNRIYLSFNKLMGDGGLQSQFSWNLTGENRQNTEIFYWPADQWQSNMLYQIFNPISLADPGIADEYGIMKPMITRGDALTNFGITDWASETRRYRPPVIVVDGLQLTPPYLWNVDPTLKSDIMIEFEDVQPQFGMRSHVVVYAFSNPVHGDYLIWKATHKFTGEIRLPRALTGEPDSLVDQTIRLWWPLSFSFGPTKAGERHTIGGFAYEGEDDLDSWFREKSVLNGARDSLYIAYYWDSKNPNTLTYPNGSKDDTGDPDRVNGHLYSTQIPGFTLLYADKSVTDKTDDPAQPYSMPHATITGDLWGRRDNGLRATYRGDDARGRFPLDAITAGLATAPQKGPMRFITVGPYDMTKNTAQNRYDSLTFVYAVGAGDIGWQAADSIGKLWFENKITDQEKNAYILQGRDSLFNVLDRANWAWKRLNQGLTIAAPPPSPDIEVTSGNDRIMVSWSYPDQSYFKDPNTGIDDWNAWRVYRKRGAAFVDDPLDQKNGARWELITEITDRNQTSYEDLNVTRGVDYYYAVTAVDNGTQNTDGIFTGQRLESSRYLNRTKYPAVPFKPGLSTSNLVRVVPNPATSAAGTGLAEGTPDKISFYNLPYKCKLKIFTETGDLVASLDHLGTADHEWDQRTDQNQYVATGIYILAVVECETTDGKKLDDNFVKFIIVR
jgi:hypothetical protein